ncbi:MAG: response regulator, partial [Pseudomonadota bacterium]
AAFLQLFGGTVEAWQGQTVHGWSPPQPGPVPARFEIRTPAQAGQAEQVYDWLEFCGADGSAFALARNVTTFVAQPGSPVANPADPVDAAPIYEGQPLAAPPPDNAPQASAHVASQAPAQPPMADSSSSQPLAAPPAHETPAHQTPPQATPATDPVAAAPVTASPVAEPAPAQSAAPSALPDIVPAAPLAQPPASPVEQASPHMPQADPGLASVPVAEESREFNRRALPIENDEAVLGNNWRDAVIAKAVGEDDDAHDLTSTLLSSDEPARKSSANAIRILLAEDNAINALLTRTLLEADGHTVETVEDGVLAVEAMKTQSYDMIFMDMRMPNMDGLEATRKIRALPNVSKDLPIVALTANAFDDDRNACFDSGMNDFMTKPVSAEELSEMVVRWTAQVPEEQRLAG